MPRLGSLSVQMKRTDNALSRYIRTVMPYCATCGSRENLTAGHVMSRSFKSTRFALDNVFTQCGACNQDHERDTTKFEAWYVRQFGAVALDALKVHSKQIRKFTVDELQKLEATFDQMTEQLSRR